MPFVKPEIGYDNDEDDNDALDDHGPLGPVPYCKEYPVIFEPPLDDGTDHDTFNMVSPIEQLKFIGSVGVVNGVAETAVYGPVPLEFSAAIWK